MFFPGGSLLDPPAEGVFLLLRKLLVRMDGRHPQGFLVVRDALIQDAQLRLAGDNHLAALAFRESSFAHVETQAGHAGALIRAMTGEAIVGKDRADISLEVNGARRCRGLSGGGVESEQNETDR